MNKHIKGLNVINVEILDNCTLLQACEWIAFKWQPMSKIYEQYEARIRPTSPMFANLNFGVRIKPSIDWAKYDAGLRKAIANLTILLMQKQLIATGRRISGNSNNAKQKNVTIKSKLTPVNFKDFYSLDIHNNQIMIKDTPIYSDITINFAELLSVSSGKTQVQTPGFYQSEYMQMMIDVIKSEGITETNPLKTELLTQIFAEKMAQAGLPKSDKLASAMATLIRPAKAQGGRNKKG